MGRIHAFELEDQPWFPRVPDANAAGGITDDFVSYDTTSVDATAVSPDRAGLRTLFNAFHHFRPAQATASRRCAPVTAASSRR